MNINLIGYEPPPREDATPWTAVLIERSETTTGPWTEVVTVLLDPVDEDPSNPRVRNFSVNDVDATATSWYQLTFKDAADRSSLPSIPVTGAYRPNYLPTVSQVGSILRARTKVDSGELGTFTTETRPTSSQVRDHIREASNDVASVLGYTVPANVHETARSLVTLGAAMLIELSYFPEQVNSNRSPYNQYKTLYDERMARAIEATAESIDDNEVDVDGEGMPSYGGFDDGNMTTISGAW